ncbi:helix-turn-helix domain-containing protein [Bdellovibrio bacteriovorus]|uniref:helix-turn-helix domain-containing protein n=1 Tax=Bdellovibrio bacteriovorus TaxID=959 RepID=UPI0035A6202E
MAPIYAIEKWYILHTLKLFSGNKTRTAESLGISIRTLRNKLHDYNLGNDE